MAVNDYGGDLRRLGAGHDIAAVKGGLKEFKGIGDTGDDIFLREVQDVWTWVRPYFDKKALASARTLGLPNDPERLGKLAPGANATLAAALIRVALNDGLRREIKG